MKIEERNVESRFLSLSQMTPVFSFIFNATVKSILMSEVPVSAAHVSFWTNNEYSRVSESHPASSYDPPFVESAEVKQSLVLQTC